MKEHSNKKNIYIATYNKKYIRKVVIKKFFHTFLHNDGVVRASTRCPCQVCSPHTHLPKLAHATAAAAVQGSEPPSGGRKFGVCICVPGCSWVLDVGSWELAENFNSPRCCRHQQNTISNKRGKANICLHKTEKLTYLCTHGIVILLWIKVLWAKQQSAKVKPIQLPCCAYVCECLLTFVNIKVFTYIHYVSLFKWTFSLRKCSPEMQGKSVHVKTQ